MFYIFVSGKNFFPIGYVPNIVKLLDHFDIYAEFKTDKFELYTKEVSEKLNRLLLLATFGTF
jgi:hypothetical protein